MKKKWKLPKDWGTYKPDVDEKGYSPIMRDLEKDLSKKLKKRSRR